MARLIDNIRTGRGAVLAAAALLVAGGGVGAGAMYAARPVMAMAPVAIQSVASLSAEGAPLTGDRIASVRGRVTEIYGSRFTLADASGKTLVEAGPRGRDGLVATGQTVTVQGRFGDGMLRAAYLVGADGKVTALDPGPHGGHGPRGPGERRGPGGPGPDARHGPPADRNGAPPPPPGARPAPPAVDGPDATDGPDA